MAKQSEAGVFKFGKYFRRKMIEPLDYVAWKSFARL
jgi:hypothetical protein